MKIKIRKQRRQQHFLETLKWFIKTVLMNLQTICRQFWGSGGLGIIPVPKISSTWQASPVNTLTFTAYWSCWEVSQHICWNVPWLSDTPYVNCRVIDRVSIQLCSIYRQSPIFSSVNKKAILANFMQISFYLSGTPSLKTGTRPPSCLHLDHRLYMRLWNILNFYPWNYWNNVLCMSWL